MAAHSGKGQGATGVAGHSGKRTTERHKGRARHSASGRGSGKVNGNDLDIVPKQAHHGECGVSFT
jgi:hypothetical protein